MRRPQCRRKRGESLFLVSIVKGKEHRLMHLDIKLSLAERAGKMDRTKLDNEIIFFLCFCVSQACNWIFIPEFWVEIIYLIFLF